MTAQAKKKKKQQQADRGWLVWVIVGVVTLGACVVVAVVVGRGSNETPNSVDGPIVAASLYAQHCANCHAIDGSGAIGPKLSDGRVVRRYPNIDDQIAVITNGRDVMPPFGDSLSDAEIRAIAEYERSL